MLSASEAVCGIKQCGDLSVRLSLCLVRWRYVMDTVI